MRCMMCGVGVDESIAIGVEIEPHDSDRLADEYGLRVPDRVESCVCADCWPWAIGLVEDPSMFVDDDRDERVRDDASRSRSRAI